MDLFQTFFKGTLRFPAGSTFEFIITPDKHRVINRAEKSLVLFHNYRYLG